MNPIRFTHKIEDKQYFTIKHFAWVTKRSECNVRTLIYKGNRIRKLRTVRFGGKPYVPYEEMLEFPFTLPGRNNKETYHYDENGYPIRS